MIQAAIVGCGHIAQKHIEAIERTRGIELKAVCDTDLGKLARIGRMTGAMQYLQMEEMLAALPGIDVVCICTPSGTHADLAVLAARAGKHLIIEKPVSLTREDTVKMQRAVRESGVKAAAVHPNRYRPAVQVLKRAMDQGLFGKISHVNATVRWNRSQAYYDQAVWRGTALMDGGVLMNQAIHSLDLLLWLFGPVSRIQAMTDTRIRSMESEDVAVAAIRFSGGALGVIEAATTVYEHNLEESISVFGEHGYAIIGGATANWIKHFKCQGMTQGEIHHLMQQVEKDPYGTPGHQRIMEDMVSAITENREPAITLEEGIQAVEFASDILHAASRKEGIYT